MVAKKPKTIAKKPSTKKPRAPSIHRQIMDKIIYLCENNDDLFLYDMNNSYAFILKNIPVTTFHVQNSESFCPHEKYKKKEFCSAFYVIWGDFHIPVQEYDFGVPSFDVRTPSEAEKTILIYDGESIEE